MNFQPQNQFSVPSNNLGFSKPKQHNPNSGMKFLIIAVILLQLAIFGLLAYGIFIPKENLTSQVVNDVRKVAGVSQTLNPIDVVQLDDNILKELRNGNQIQEEVYKDAKAGDFVVLYDTRMIIYRQDGSTIVYDGLPPSQIAQNNQLELLNTILTKVKDLGLVDQGEEEVPQASVVDDPSSLIAQDSDFYARVQKGDIIAVFPKNKLIVLYNPNNESIYNYGSVTTSISKN